MDPTQSNDINQVGTNTSQSLMPSQPNYLTPQQRMQMAMYSNQLANKPLPPVTSVTGGIGNMVSSFMDGQNQASMMNGTQPGSGALGSFLSNLTNQPMQLPSANGGASGPPMQLSSANGGGSPLGIFQGLFGGNNGSTS